MRPAVTFLFCLATLAGLGCREIADIEDIQPAPDASTDAAARDADATGKDARESSAACMKIAVDASVPDAPPDAVCPASAEATACTPGPNVGFKPSWVPPNAPAKRCTASQINTLYDVCFAPGMTVGACLGWQAANMVCKDCVFSSSADPSGPVVYDEKTHLEAVNEAGCVALLEPCNLECAHVMQANMQCEETACDPGCPLIASQATYEEDLNCYMSADTCPCQAYTEGQTLCEEAIGARTSAANVCVLANSNIASAFKQVISLFCGT